jgi:hypothetical protein
MPILSKPSGAARTAVIYVTVGALIDVWTVIYWVYLGRHPEGHAEGAYYWVYGFFFTGLVLLVIGLALGRIGRAARHAELPPELPPDLVSEPGVPVAPRIASTPATALYYTVPGQVAPVPAQPQAAPNVANTVRTGSPTVG